MCRCSSITRYLLCRVPHPLPLHVMSGNEGVSATAAMEEAASRNVRTMINSQVESMAAIGGLILECRKHWLALAGAVENRF